MNQRGRKYPVRTAASKKAWTPEEEKILREVYPEIGVKVADLLPGRSAKACMVRANKLGILADYDMWTAQEDKTLRERYPIVGKAVYHELHGRSEGACKARAVKLGILSDNGQKRKNTFFGRTIRLKEETLQSACPAEPLQRVISEQMCWVLSGIVSRS